MELIHDNIINLYIRDKKEEEISMTRNILNRNFGYIIYFIYNNKVILLFLFLVLLLSIYFWLQIIINNFDSFINLSMNEYLLLILIVALEVVLPISIMIFKIRNQTS